MFQQTPRMPSNLAHKFSEVPAAHIPRSVFDRPSEYHTAHDAGFLIPFYTDEVLPGDTHTVNARVLSRLLTPIVPFMSNLYLDVFWFYCPDRLLWSNWERFNGSQDNPDDSTDYTMPLMYLPSSTGWAEESLQDYLNYGTPGIAGNDTATYAVHNMYGRMYNFVYNTFFRDQNLQDSVVVDTDDGPDDPADYVLLRRGKRHDYFTSCLPWPQKGESLALFLSGQAPVYGRALSASGSTVGGNPDIFVGNASLWQISTTNAASDIRTGTLNATASEGIMIDKFVAGGSGATSYPANFGSGTVAWEGLSMGTEAQYTAMNAAFGSNYNQPMFSPPYADLDAATSNTINEFRTAFQLQMLLENDARGGTRYIELLLAHFGVVSPDFRLQRPEYLGGGSIPIHMTSVPQTGQTDNTPQGNLAAFALFDSRRNGFSKSFVEHGRIMGLLSIRSDLAYQQGVARDLLRRTRFDFYWPAFAHLGEQVVTNAEIYLQGAAGGAADSEPFGYQERAAEYRYKNSCITGKMRSTSATTLDYWHLGQEFSSLPTLGPDFIVEDPPIARVIAVQDEPQFQTNVYVSCRSARPMPVYSVPGLLTRL